MRRVILLLPAVAIVSAMMAASAAPAFAAGFFKFGHGATQFKAGHFHAVFTPSGRFHCC